MDESGPTPTPGPLLATQTELSSIPYRPSADPVNCTGPNAGQWLDPSDNTCRDGFAQTHDQLTDNTPLPDQVIWTVAFNTTNFGPNPIGPVPCSTRPDNCDYNWSNVGERTFPGAPFEGTNTDPDAAFLDSSWGAPTATAVQAVPASFDTTHRAGPAARPSARSRPGQDRSS